MIFVLSLRYTTKVIPLTSIQAVANGDISSLHTPRLLYPFNHRETLGLLLCLGYCI